MTVEEFAKEVYDILYKSYDENIFHNDNLTFEECKAFIKFSDSFWCEFEKLLEKAGIEDYLEQ